MFVDKYSLPRAMTYFIICNSKRIYSKQFNTAIDCLSAMKSKCDSIRVQIFKNLAQLLPIEISKP